MAKEIPTHYNKLGREVTVGATIAFCLDNVLYIGRVKKLNSKKITVDRLPASRWKTTRDIVSSRDSVLVPEEDVILYLLSDSARS